MKMDVYKEEYAIRYSTAYENDALLVTWSELKSAEVGASWSIDDQDRFPNPNVFWKVTYTIVYRNANGVAILKETTEPGEEPVLVWFAFA